MVGSVSCVTLSELDLFGLSTAGLRGMLAVDILLCVVGFGELCSELFDRGPDESISRFRFDVNNMLKNL